MQLSELTAITSVDGRYHNKTKQFGAIFSEYGLIKHRLLVELKWLIHLSQTNGIDEVSQLDQKDIDWVMSIYDNFTPEEAQKVKDIEATTNHDVKAVEYYIKEQLSTHPELNQVKEFVHFACTSEDINNLSYALMLKAGRDNVCVPAIQGIINQLSDMAMAYAEVPMMAKTHGQPASPTTMGKELANVVARLDRARDQVATTAIRGKFNGAVGNFNAHLIAYPELDWLHLSQNFVECIGLDWQQMTTQIEPHDDLAALCHAWVRLNTILIDLDRDLWGYISLGYFRQKTVDGEVGSSTMPHKVNPIDFENSEGNAGMANALLEHLATKLPVSRWQRDLSDSTVMRNLGPAFAHCLLALDSACRGLGKLEVDETRLNAELDKAWEVLAGAIQTVMRRYNVPEPYEKLKALTRGCSEIDAATLRDFVTALPIPKAAQDSLAALTPQTYTGNAAASVRMFLQERHQHH